MTESDIQKQIQVALTEAGARVFRNNSAMAWAGDVQRLKDGSVLIRNPRPIHAGLGVGSADLIGIANGGRFLSVEVKTQRGVIRPEQIAWRDMVIAQGGSACIARSVDEAVTFYRGCV